MRIKEAFIRDVINKHAREEISFSRMCEIINEEANKPDDSKCDHSNTGFQKINCSVCLDCGYIVEIDV